MNQVNLLGVCVSEPFQTQHPDKSNPTLFNLLVTEWNLGKKIKWLVPVKAWGKAGQRISEQVKKGTWLVVEGRLTPNTLHNPAYEHGLQICEVTVVKFFVLSDTPMIAREDCGTDNL